MTNTTDRHRHHEGVAVVVTGAEPLPAHLRPSHLVSPDVPVIVIAADGGADHAVAAGWTLDVIVGDLDSIEQLPAGVDVVRHPADKDATDTELAIAEAIGRGVDRLVVIAGGGDRLDHQLAIFGALGHPTAAALGVVEAWWGGDRLHVIHGPRHRRIAIEPGVTFSALTLHGPARGIDVTGAEWSLANAELPAGSGRGISNVARRDHLDIAVGHGVLTIVIPGAQP